MFKLLAVACLVILGSVAQASEATYEQMYRNSFVSYCDAKYCTDVDTGEQHELEPGQAVKAGYVINFSQHYTTEQIQKAMPYILERYKEAQHE